ncbi:MAG: response regulator [Candidatus Auribacter fodinae]|jgi:PAS domain S-box-containing protein|uniref:histidine kinase n=1 Tax=Candidatus Auribacter fodinae TaxID=2093366 RepID=A0A3A4RAL5_9BACT|nr:MAG: response regulator [Candidatus Auribacter fodinae]
MNKILSQEILERRNRAFRVLYDTVIQVNSSPDEQVYSILCGNLRLICDADAALLFSFDKAARAISLEAVSVEGSTGAPPSKNQQLRGIPLPEKVLALYSEQTITKIMDVKDSLISVLPNSCWYCSFQSNNECLYYTLTLKKETDITGFAIIRRPSGKPLKMKDMVDTFLGLAGVIIQRKNAIDALNLSNKWFQTLLHSSPVGIILVNGNKEIVEINSAALELVSKKRDDIIGQKCSVLMCEDVTHRCPIFDEGKRVNTAEREIKHADGYSIPILKNVIPIEINHERYLVESFMDIREHKKMKEELMRARQLESIGVLAGGIAHDFNNLLTAILGNIDLALNANLSSEEMREILQGAKKASLNAKKLSSQFLTFAKGGNPIKESVSLEEIVRDSATFVLKGSAIKCEFDIEQNISPVNADKGQINQVIHNLILNAMQAMPDGGIIYVTLKNETISNNDPSGLQPGSYVHISIQDTGIGINPENLSKIFDPYFTTKEFGSGLGLSTTYSIVKKHGGAMSVKSELGTGTIFTIHLPCAARPCAHQPESLPAEKKTYYGTGKILVMDDEDMVRELLESALTTLGYKVTATRDGKEALEVFKNAWDNSQPFDLVIMDLTIPGGMGGKETITRLKREYPQARAIVSSGYSNDPVMADHTAYGFSGMVVKPFDIHDLSATIHNVINN